MSHHMLPRLIRVRCLPLCHGALHGLACGLPCLVLRAQRCRLSAGVPTQETSIGVLSTAVVLEMEATRLARPAAVDKVATAFGIEAASVHGKDWLQIMTTEDQGDRKKASDVGLVCAGNDLQWLSRD